MTPVAPIELSGVEFTYPKAAAPTLRVRNFEVRSGESVFLYGPSGLGKTTLLEVLAGVLVPQKGEVKILGRDFVAMSPAARDAFRADHIGYIFQSFNLIPYLSVDENIRLPLHFSERRRAKLAGRSVDDEVRRLIGALGIGQYVDRRVTELSVGQQQRVAVARALIGSPELILADEPTSALDQDHREKFLRLLFDLAKADGITVLFVSHDRGIKDLFSRAVALADLGGAR